jgi:hypothetical protein
MTDGDHQDPKDDPTSLEEFEAVSDRFKSDTRNYLKAHLLDEYETPAQAVIYNILQNAVDNRVEGTPLEVRFQVDSTQKTLEVLMSGTTGIRDWDRYNALHYEGSQGSRRRGEGAKILVPIARSVRTESRLGDGAYRQSIWWSDHILRSDNPAHTGPLSRFPASDVPAGATRIVADGLIDEVGDRLAGLDLVNARMVQRIIQQDWFLLLEDPSARIYYSIDGDPVDIRTPSVPDLEDHTELTDVPVSDAGGEEVGKFSRVILRLARSPLRGQISPGIAVCTDAHAVSYYQLSTGPNSSKLWGYAIAPFLATSETTNHFAFKSTRQWRAAKIALTRIVNQFMEKHAGVEEVDDPRLRRVLGQVTDQINRIIRDKFPDWHPEGGFGEKHEPPDQGHELPWISMPELDKTAPDPGAACTFTFAAVGADKTKRSVEARVAVASARSRLYAKSWSVDLGPKERRSISDSFTIPEDSTPDFYTVRFSIADPREGTVSDRRLYFKVGEPEERPHKERRTAKRKPRESGQFALREARTGLFPAEEGRIRESHFYSEPPEGPAILINRKAPQYLEVEDSDEAWRYHIARCHTDELAALKFERELNLRGQDELGKDALALLYRDMMLERSTFLAEWAREELARRGSKAEPTSKAPE